MATLIRAELSPPGLQMVDPTFAGMPHRIVDYAVQFTAWNMAFRPRPITVSQQHLTSHG
jgi:hypothetical protein